MSAYHTVGRVGDLGEGEARTIIVGKKLIALFRHSDQYYAIDDCCPHMGASLSTGWVEQGVVTCCWHAWRFRLSDGAWLDNPRLKIGCYAVRVVGDEIQVEVESPAPAVETQP